ncbi:hypothetical protein IWQ61_005350 [Dispira simplex]|nr:hypothetical protein IWQ61_005350 [Dispira simplex]
MNLAKEIDDLPPSQELVQFYREKLENTQSTFAELSLQVDHCKVVQKDYQTLHTELQERLVELAELQNVLQKTQEALLAEKQKVFALQKENDTLKVQELEDRKKMRYLISRAQGLQWIPSLHRNEFDAESLPFTKKRTHVPQDKESTTKTPRTLNGGEVTTARIYPQASLDDASDPVLTEVSREALRLKVKALEAQLEEQRSSYEKLNQNLATQNTLLTQREADRTQQEAEASQALMQKYHQIHGFYTDNLKDVLYLRRQKDQTETSYRQQLLVLETNVNHLTERLNQSEDRFKSTQRTAERELTQRYETTVNRLQKSLDRSNAELVQLKEETAETERKLSDRVQSLTIQAERHKSSFQSYRTRLYLEIEGCVTDCAALLRKLTLYQQTILRLSITNDQATTLLQGVEDFTNGVDRTIQELNRLKQRCMNN